MHKLIIGLMVIFFLGDSGLETLAWLGEMKIYMVAAAVALVSIPFWFLNSTGDPGMRAAQYCPCLASAATFGSPFFT